MVFNRKSKKAMSSVMIAVVSAVIFAVGIIAVLYLFQGITKASEQNTYITTCKASLASYAKIGALSIPSADAKAKESKIDCPTKYIVIEDEDGRDIKRKIANLMAECWFIYAPHATKFTSIQKETFCAIHSIIEFEDKSMKIDSFSEFLLEEKAPKAYSGGRKKYIEFFIERTPSKAEVEKINQYRNMYLDSSKRYAIIFTGGWILGEAPAFVSSAMHMFNFPVMEAGSPSLPIEVMEVSGIVEGRVTKDILLVEYNEDTIANLGCQSLPISQLDQKFR